MADKTIKTDDDVLSVHISDEVVTVIAGIAATEVEGVASLVGNVPTELISRMGIRNLSKGIKIAFDGKKVDVSVTLNIAYGYNIQEVCREVQEKVASSIENMTGLKCGVVDTFVSDISIK